MTQLTIKLPDLLLQKVNEFSKARNIPVDELIAASLAQKLNRITPDPYLEERAKRATGEGFSAVLSNVPDVPAEEYDQI